MRSLIVYIVVMLGSLFYFATQARTVTEQDSLALIALYNSTDGTNWTDKWDLTEPVNTWHGIVVDDDTKRVYAIDLKSNNLVGTLPAEIGNLKPVAVLLQNNKLQGSIPVEIGNLTVADAASTDIYLRYLSLAYNQFTGSIPPELFKNYALFSLSLAGNRLTGTIPKAIEGLAVIDTLDLSGNKLSGTIPASILNAMTNLSHLDLSSNNLTGTFPTQYDALSGRLTLETKSNSLRTLILTGNRLTALPDLLFFQTKNLKTLEVDFNHLSFQEIEKNKAVLTKYSPQYGPGRKYIIGSSNLTLTSTVTDANSVYQWFKDREPITGATSNNLVLNSPNNLDIGIYFCKVTNPSYSGITLYNPIDTLVTLGTPSSRDSLALVAFYRSTNGSSWIRPWNLEQQYITWRGVELRDGRVASLNLEKNRLTGTIPSEIGNLDSLTNLDLNTNQITGIIPASLGNLTKLQTIALYNNQLSDTIPNEIGNLKQLVGLALNNNNLSGNLPSTLANLTNLEYLLLYGNQFTGNISNNIGNLTKLIQLRLDHNQLSGSIPRAIGSLSQLTLLALSGNQLTGSIPSTIGGLTKLLGIYLADNQLSGSIPSTIGNLSSLTDLNLKSNQLSGSIPSELGNLSNLEWVSIRSNKLTGAVPSSITNLTKLDFLWLYDNLLDDLPDLSALSIGDLKVQNNRFDFQDIRPNLNLLKDSINYSPQTIRDGASYINDLGSSLTLSVDVAGTGNLYQWYKNNRVLSAQTSKDLVLTNIEKSDSGHYYCEVKNPSVVKLVLLSLPDTVDVSNQPPTDIQLSSTSIEENKDVGTSVGNITTTDPDAVDTHTYTLSGTDAASFRIQGSQLQNRAVFDFETKSSYSIAITSKDAGGLTFVKDFTITVTDVDETPTALPEGQLGNAINAVLTYPNPSSGLIKMAGLDKVRELEIQVINLRGQVVKTFREVQTSYDLTDLAKGTYILRIQADGETQRLTFILN